MASRATYAHSSIADINITPGSGHRWTSKKAEPRNPADAQLALVLDTTGIAYGPDACPSYQAERTASKAPHPHGEMRVST